MTIEQRRIDYVQIELETQPPWTGPVSWEDRERLVAELERVSGGKDVVALFAAVGATRPVKIYAWAMQPMREAVHALEVKQGGAPLSEGLNKLREALIAG